MELHAGVGYVDSNIKEMRFTDEDVPRDEDAQRPAVDGERERGLSPSARHQRPDRQYRLDYVWQARNYDAEKPTRPTSIRSSTRWT